MTRQQDWTDKLRDKLAAHEAVVPEGLWTDIERSLPRQQAVFTPLWHRFINTAAILILAVIMGWWLWPEDKPWSLTADRGVGSTQRQPTTQQSDAALVAQVEAIPAVPAQRSHVDTIEESTEESVTPTTVVAEAETTATEIGTTATEAEEVAQATPPSVQQPQTAVLQQPTATSAPMTKQRHTIAVGLYANSELLPNSLGIEGSLTASEDHLYNSSTENQPPLSFPETDRPVRHEEHHDHPVVVGLTIGIPLTGRWTLATGVIYTRLHSEFTAITDHSRTTTDQTLHYLGIPLNLQYHIWGGGQWKAYASIGTEADWNLYAGTAAKDRLQWSAGGAIGAEYNVVPQLGLYVEPGFRYYFDNHSPVRNFFKDQPLNWSLQLGIRLKLGDQ